ncbi:MAG: DUF5671 domain-containing protein [Acidimicrobiia bacterium]
MAFGIIIPIILLGAIAMLVVAMIRRGTAKGGQPGGDGSDLLIYLLLAVAVGTLVFSLASLGRAAFPGGAFVFDPERQVATALAGIVVSAPFAVYLWRRQRARRVIYPGAAGWTVYLALIEAVFMTSFAITLFNLLDWLISDGSEPALSDVLILGGVIVFHELAMRATPPSSDAGELPRIIGTAAGLVPLAIGLGGLLHRGLSELYASMASGNGGGDGFEPLTSLALIITGIPIWWYRWWRPWDGPPGPPRAAWTFLVSTVSLATTLGAVCVLVAQTLIYLLTDSSAAGAHFDFLATTLAVGIVAVLVWAHHRWRLGKERTDPVRAYEYMTAAIAMAAGVGAVTTLIAAVFGESAFVGSSGSAAIAAATVLLVAFLVWFRFWRRGQAAPRGIEASGAPRRFYLLGLGVIMALIGAGALIATFVFIFQAVLGVESLSRSFVATVTLFLAAGGAAWHLLRTYVADRALTASGEAVTPFDVTIICSHPGMLSARLPKQARVQVIYRSDESAYIDDEMADAIVSAVGTSSSLVWVDETGFRVAPAR